MHTGGRGSGRAGEAEEEAEGCRIYSSPSPPTHPTPCLKTKHTHMLAAPCRLIEGPWWGRCLGRQPGAWWLAHVDAAALNGEPLRRRIGYLNTLEDLLKHLGHRMQVGAAGAAGTASPATCTARA